MFMILPFYMLAIKAERDNVQGGIISGREALRVALTVFAVSALIISVYHYIEFETWIKHMAPRYYTSDEYMQFLKRQTKVKPEQFPRIIATQIAAAERGAFVATSVKLFGFLLIAVPAALLATLVMKRRRK
jgi:disulfide bond formation protein DsbB